MSWNYLSGANFVAQLPHLTYLSLLHNKSIVRLPDFTPLAQLRYLSLAEVMPLQALPSGLWTLSALTSLDMSSMQVEVKEMPDDAFARMRNLRFLSLSCCTHSRAIQATYTHATYTRLDS